MNIKSLTTVLIVAFLLVTSTSTFGQSAVIYLDGDAFVEEVINDKTTYKKIVYGPLPSAEKLVLKEASTLRLLNEDNHVCELNKEGTYTIADLKFVKPETNSMFAKFCDYFHSFFVSHASSESKANYKNSIYAISRGRLSAPSLDFPLEGTLPSDAGSIPFVWSHACDTCQYVLSINNLKTKANVFAHTGSQQSHTLADPAKFLVSGEQYYWSVNVSGVEVESEKSIFMVAEKQTYSKTITAAESAAQSLTHSSPEILTVYVMSEMMASDQVNYALLYGFGQQEKHPANEQITDLVQRAWYDLLLE